MTQGPRKEQLIALRTFEGRGGRKVQAGETYECHPTVAAGLVSSGRARRVEDRDRGSRSSGARPAETKPRKPAETKKSGEDESVDPILDRMLRRVCGSRGLRVTSTVRRSDGVAVIVDGGELVGSSDGDRWAAYVRGSDSERSGLVGESMLEELPALAGSLADAIASGGLPAMVDLEELGAKEAAAYVADLDSVEELERYRKREGEGKGRKTVFDAISTRIAALRG